MNRTESYPSLETHSISMDMVRSTIEVSISETEEIKVLISGDDESVSLLHMQWEDGRLSLAMPIRDRVPNLMAPAWMQIVLRLPSSWKGAMELKSQSGSLSVDGYTGTDLILSTTSGHIRAEHIHCLTSDLRSLSGSLFLNAANCEEVRLSTVSGNLLGEGLAYHSLHLTTVTGSTVLEFASPFQTLSGNSVSGSTTITVPMQEINAKLKAVTGRLLTRDISIQDQGPEVRFNSVVGNLEIVGHRAPQEV